MAAGRVALVPLAQLTIDRGEYPESRTIISWFTPNPSRRSLMIRAVEIWAGFGMPNAALPAGSFFLDFSMAVLMAVVDAMGLNLR